MSDVHSPAFWKSMQAHHKETQALHAAFATYHDACDRAHEWATRELAAGRTLAEVVPVLRLKYRRADQALKRGVYQ